MSNLKILRSLSIICLFSLPLSAWANSGTPLMIGMAFHLELGNLFLGFGEAFLLVKIYKTAWRKSIFTMIAANYFSAWAGMLLLGWISSELSNIIDIYNFRQYWLIMLIAAYLITILLEYGFILLAMGCNPWKFLAALKASWLIQSISYLVLIGWYMLFSEGALLWTVKPVAPLELKTPPGIMVYYLGTADKALYCWNSNTLKTEKIRQLDCRKTQRYLLAAIQSDSKPSAVDLVRFVFDEQDYNSGKYEMLIPAFSAVDKSNPLEKKNCSLSYGSDKAISLGEAKLLPVEYTNCFYSNLGIVRQDKISGENRHILKFEVPFIQWPIHNVIVLPGDKLLLQLGEQICIFNPKTMEMALIARGSGFVAVVE